MTDSYQTWCTYGAPGAGCATEDDTATIWTVSSLRNIMAMIITPTIDAPNGWRFMGWSKTENTDTVDLQPGEPLRNICTPDPITLYAVWESAHPFQVTTNETSNFQFNISAQGTFNVDCGTNGILTVANDSNTLPITDNTTFTTPDVSTHTVTCTYSDTDEYPDGRPRTIKFV